MTKHGKCETCRQRKVKCDEKWPTCGACSIKNRPCKYVEASFIHEQQSTATSCKSESPESDDCQLITTRSTTTTTKSATLLRLKRQRKAKAGNGEFLTFEPVKDGEKDVSLPSPTPALLSAQERSISKLGSIFGYTAFDLGPLTPWVKLPWTSTGTSKCLELAAQYALSTVHVFQDEHCPESMERASKVGLAAIHELKSCIESFGRKTDKDAMLVAIMLHFTAENFAGVATWRYIPHLQGICSLLNNYYKDQPNNSMVQNIVSMICNHEICVAMFMGTPSQLEGIARPQYSLASPQQLDIALMAIDDLRIKLPRLVRHVRECVADPQNLSKLAPAIDFARHIYNSDEDLYVKEAVLLNSTRTISMGDEALTPTGMMMDFDTPQAFILATRYYTHRMILTGLMHSLALLDQPNMIFDDGFVSQAEQGELHAATAIVECLDYAMHSGRASSIAISQLLFPFELALSVWDRAAQRESFDTESPQYQHAWLMRSWTLEQAQNMSSRWKSGPIPRLRMDVLYGVFVGGPLVPGAARRTDVQEDLGMGSIAEWPIESGFD